MDRNQQFEMGPRLVIVCGLPGSGKTCHAKTIEERLDAVRFAPDEWLDALGSSLWDSHMRARIESLQWNMSQRLLRLGCNVVIEWGTWARSERDVLRTGARALGAAVELHYLNVPVDTLFERIRQRDAEEPAITLEDLRKWAALFEEPSAEEMALFDQPTVT